MLNYINTHWNDLSTDENNSQSNLYELDLNKRQQKLLDKIINDPSIPDDDIEHFPIIGQECAYSLNHLITPSTANSKDMAQEISQQENDKKMQLHSQIKETLNNITASLLR